MFDAGLGLHNYSEGSGFSPMGKIFTNNSSVALVCITCWIPNGGDLIWLYSIGISILHQMYFSRIGRKIFCQYSIDNQYHIIIPHQTAKTKLTDKIIYTADPPFTANMTSTTNITPTDYASYRANQHSTYRHIYCQQGLQLREHRGLLVHILLSPYQQPILHLKQRLHLQPISYLLATSHLHATNTARHFIRAKDRANMTSTTNTRPHAIVMYTYCQYHMCCKYCI